MREYAGHVPRITALLVLFLISALPISLLPGCSTSTQRAAPVEDRTRSADARLLDNAHAPPSALQPAPDVPPERPRVSPQTSAGEPPVIVALLDDAEQAEVEGRPEAAAATLERALKIEPKNALLWNRLAGVRLRQGDWQQALEMARRSNALAAGDYELQTENWFLILAIMQQTGNAQGIEDARKKIETLRRQGSGVSG
jgi:tetratricopeptide (TPR) repeat protein